MSYKYAVTDRRGQHGKSPRQFTFAPRQFTFANAATCSAIHKGNSAIDGCNRN